MCRVDAASTHDIPEMDVNYKRKRRLGFIYYVNDTAIIPTWYVLVVTPEFVSSPETFIVSSPEMICKMIAPTTN